MIKISKKFLQKKKCLQSVSMLLTAFAIFFANAPCQGRIYEPEVPENLQGRIF